MALRSPRAVGVALRLADPPSTIQEKRLRRHQSADAVVIQHHALRPAVDAAEIEVQARKVAQVGQDILLKRLPADQEPIWAEPEPGDEGRTVVHVRGVVREDLVQIVALDAGSSDRRNEPAGRATAYLSSANRGTLIA